MDWQSVLLGAVPFVLGIGLVGTKVKKIMNALKELADVLTTVVAAFGDNELTKTEIKAIKKEGIEAISALKAILK